MSESLIVSGLVIPSGTNPDFDAARAALLKLRRSEIVRRIEDSTGNDLVYDYGDGESASDVEFVRRRLAVARPAILQCVQDVEDAWLGERPDASTLHVMGYDVLVGGGASYGDCPEIVTSIDNFQVLDLDVAAGFVRNPS